MKEDIVFVAVIMLLSMLLVGMSMSFIGAKGNKPTSIERMMRGEYQ